MSKAGLEKGERVWGSPPRVGEGLHARPPRIGESVKACANGADE